MTSVLLDFKTIPLIVDNGVVGSNTSIGSWKVVDDVFNLCRVASEQFYHGVRDGLAFWSYHLFDILVNSSNQPLIKAYGVAIVIEFGASLHGSVSANEPRVT